MAIQSRFETARFDRSDPRMNLLGRRSGQPLWWLPGEWKKIIGQYSFKRLSYTTNTLPALAGLASRLASREGMYLGKYLASL